MGELISHGIMFGSIIVSYMIVSLIIKWGVKQLFSFDIKPYWKKLDVVVVVVLIISMTIMGIFNFSHVDNTIDKMPTYTEDVVVCVPSVDKLKEEVRVVKEEADEDNNQALSDAVELFRNVE